MQSIQLYALRGSAQAIRNHSVSAVRLQSVPIGLKSSTGLAREKISPHERSLCEIARVYRYASVCSKQVLGMPVNFRDFAEHVSAVSPACRCGEFSYDQVCSPGFGNFLHWTRWTKLYRQNRLATESLLIAGN